MQTRLESEGWTWLTNHPTDAYVQGLKRQFGAENVRLHEAYDVFGNRLDTDAVYARENAIEQAKQRETEMLDLTYKPVNEADKNSHIFRRILHQAMQEKKGDQLK